jgi:transcription initiation factor TFIIA large subunit
MPGASLGSQALSNAQALARERAMNNLQSKYGAAAASSVSQLQAQSQTALSLPGQQRAQNGQQPIGVLPDVKPPQPYQGVPQPQRAPYIPPQTDGTDEALIEWKAEVARRREAAQRQNGEGDSLLMQQLRLQALRLEAGGLMLPLDERSSLKLSKATQSHVLTSPAQVDGTDDDEKEEEDEDAINSDLDDPDDLVAEEHDGDDAVGQVMLCTYDKVQRVKNKWKCTLKDGILSTGGKEWVFSLPILSCIS